MARYKELNCQVKNKNNSTDESIANFDASNNEK